MRNSEFVDLVINQMKANNVDEVPPRRFILQVGRVYAKNFISQKLSDRTLFRESNIYTTIECVEMKKVEAINCPLVSLRRCQTLMKSVKVLPELIYSRLGSSIKNIQSVDGGFQFTIGYEEQIRNNSKRKYQFDEVYAYVGTDNHLYIPNEEIYTLMLDLITLKTEDCGCGEECKSAWEYEFIVPDRLLQTVVDQTVNRAMIYKQLPQDQNPDNVVGQ